MKLRTAVCAAAIFSFSGCATIQEPARSCSLEGLHGSLSRMKAANEGLGDPSPLVRLRSARAFSAALGQIYCAESLVRKEQRLMEMAKYAILDASIAALEDKDPAVRLASIGTIRELVVGLGLGMDRLSFSALSIGLKDESQDVREATAEIIGFVCSGQPGLCQAAPEKKGTFTTVKI